MPITEKSARGRVSMRLDARLPEGNVILCTGHGDEHSFAFLSAGSVCRSSVPSADGSLFRSI